jgi:hexosaminidase
MIRRELRAAVRAAALILSATAPVAAYGGVIPLPAEVVTGVGYFSVAAATTVRVPRGDRDADQAARYLVELWTRTNGLTLPVTIDTTNIGAAGTDCIAFERHSGFGPEAYAIEVSPHRITVSAASAAGLFYGAVTLWQLLPPGGATGQIPAQTIRDAPAYAWRGLMLDSARHFQSPVFIRSMINWMALHKLNVLHWHLTDDQGWRLEIRKYPRLTSVGAWRIDPGGKRYGGFYTQDEVRDIVRFAATRHVQIVPEIETPGHATAAIAAYPSVGATGDRALRVSASWGIHTHLFNLEPGTFEFLENVLGEVLKLFPSPYIHVGGDEAVKDEWNASPTVQARASQLGIHGADAMQAYFTQKIVQFLAAHGRRAVGWDEIMQPGLPSDAVVMAWHGASGGHAAAIRGNDTVLAPDPALYFDRRQSNLAVEPPGRLNVISLEDVYRFEPDDRELSDSQRRHILGLQAELWTEHIASGRQVEWMALPRAAALAEVGWSSRRSWPDFLRRLLSMSARYRALDLDYADSVFGIDAHFARSADGVSVTLGNLPELRDAALDPRIHYTLDGQEPNTRSALYTAPFTVAVGTEIRAATFLESQQASRTWSSRPDAHTGARRSSHELELCSNGIGILLEPSAGAAPDAPLAVDILNPCWIYRDVELGRASRVTAAVAALPFNFELGLDAAKIRVGDNRTPVGELEVHVDGCDTAALGVVPLAPAAGKDGITELPPLELPPLSGRHDVCLRFARPRLDPLWALDWVEIENQ